MPVPKPKPLNPFQPDPTFINNQAQNQFQVNNQLAGLNRTGVIDQADNARALQNLAQRQVQSRQQFNGGAARNGSLYSGRAMQNYGYMNRGYQQQQNDMGEALRRRQEDRTMQAAQIHQGQQFYNNAEESSLVDRNRQRLAQQLSMMMPLNPYQAATKGQFINLLSKQLNTPTVSTQGILK